MGGNAVKSLVLISLLLFASFFVGSQIAGAKEDKLFAFALIGAVVGLFGTIFVGRKIWWLFYLVPWILAAKSFQSDNMLRGGISWQFITAPAFLAAWLILFMFRRVRLSWCKNIVLDFLILCFFSYIAATYVRRPVTLRFLQDFGYGGDLMGGQEYLYAILAVVYYIAISVITVPKQDFELLFKRMFYCFLFGQIIGVILNFAGMNGVRLLEVGSAGDGDVRCHAYNMLAFGVATYVLSRYRFFSIRSVAGLSFATLSIFISGSREYIGRFGALVAMLSLMKKEVIPLLLAVSMGVGGVMLLSHMGYAEKLPGSMQRVAQLIPGVKVSENIRIGTKGSTEARIEFWKMALDPREGLIKDRVWGDGFGQSRRATERMQIGWLRRGRSFDLFEMVRMTGGWHNGFISTTHRFGYVMVGILFVLYSYTFILTCRIFMATRGTALCAYVMVPVSYMLHEFFFYWWFDNPGRAINSVVTIGYVKLIVCHLIDEGKWVPLFSRRRYVPMMVREMGSGAGA